jgi:hypothetical protein
MEKLIQEKQQNRKWKNYNKNIDTISDTNTKQDKPDKGCPVQG